MRRAIAIVAISPRRISYITITLLLLNVTSGCARDKVLRFRGQRMNDAHRKLIVRNWDRPRSVVESDHVRIYRVCSLRYRPTSTVSHTQALRRRTYFTTLELCLWCLSNTGLERRREKFLVAISITIITPRSR